MMETYLNKDLQTELLKHRQEWSKSSSSAFVQTLNPTPVILISLGFSFLFSLYPTGSLSLSAAYFATGWIFMSLIEYFSHRFTFHVYLQKKARRGNKTLVHMSHHAEPKIGINAAWFIAFVYAPIFVLLGLIFTWSLAKAMPFSSGMAVGFALYELSHYLLHVDHPPFKYYRWMARFHDLHHHKNWKANFGITSPIWDFVFKTYSPAKKTYR